MVTFWVFIVLGSFTKQYSNFPKLFLHRQTTSAADQPGRRVRRQHKVGARGHPPPRLDNVLLLHLEGRQVDRQGRLLHLPLPLPPADDTPDPRYHATGRHRWHSLLRQSEPLQAKGIRGEPIILHPSKRTRQR